MKNLDKIPKKNSELAWRVIDNEAIILPLDEQAASFEKINLLNETGARIWELIDGERPINDITVKICREYAIDDIEAEKEVTAFVKKLSDKNLIKF